MEPRNHRVSFKYEPDREVTGDVVWVRQQAPGVGELVLVCSDIVTYGHYPATYRTPKDRALGTVSIMNARYVDGWCVYGGTFTKSG